MKNISKLCNLTTKKFSTNTTKFKSKIKEFNNETYKKLRDKKNLIEITIDNSRLMKYFIKNFKKDPTTNELDTNLIKNLEANQEIYDKEESTKILVNEIESYLNSLGNQTSISDINNSLKKEYENLEILMQENTKSDNNENRKLLEKNLSKSFIKQGSYEQAIYSKLFSIKNQVVHRPKLLDRTEEQRQDKKDKFSLLNTTYVDKFVKTSTQLNNRINLNHKLELEIIENPNYIHHFVNVNTLDDYHRLEFEDLEFKRILLTQNCKAPSLLHDLMVVVNNPGIYKVEAIKNLHNTNIDFLENIPEPQDVNFDNFETFIPANKDKNLATLAKKNNLKYVSSTSGIGSLLNHLFYKLTNFKTPHFYNLSEAYDREPLKFMMFQRKPTSVILSKHPENYYSISSDKFFEHKNYTLLMHMGKYMEKIFTTEPETFKRKYTYSKGANISPEESMDKGEDFYSFMSFSNTLLRSQIDCVGKNKNNREIYFEIKTRAVCPIRYDLDNYKDYLDYELKTLLGHHSSYEREFYDLIRGAFLKYLFQIKIGGMEGAFISYHNTKKIYGFEYIKLEDMQRRIFGNSNFSDIIFKSSIRLLECIFDRVLLDFGGESNNLKIGFFANEWKNSLDVFVEILNSNSYSDTHKYEYNEYIDYFHLSNYKPIVYKYSVNVLPVVNDLVNVISPMLFEKFDNYECRYKIIFQGRVSFEEYMKFVHEAYSSDTINIENQFSGSWSGHFQ